MGGGLREGRSGWEAVLEKCGGGPGGSGPGWGPGGGPGGRFGLGPNFALFFPLPTSLCFRFPISEVFRGIAVVSEEEKERSQEKEQDKEKEKDAELPVSLQAEAEEGWV